MKLCTVIFAALVASVATYAVEQGPLIKVLSPKDAQDEQVAVLDPRDNTREKRSLLLGGLGAGVLGAGIIGAGALGLGAIGAAGLVGAKAGFLGGALASKAYSGRSYGGGWGYGGYSGYGGYGGHYNGYGGHYGGYRSYYPTYVVSEHWW